MTDEELIQEFTQQVYLTIWNRRIEDIEDEDGQEEIAKVIIWCNLFLDELEREADWNFVRENEKELGTAVTGANTLDLFDDDIRKLVVDENRPLVIKQDSSVVSVWDVVDPNQLTRRNNYSDRDQRVTFITQKLVFSRVFNDTEVGGKVCADIINKIPRLATNDTSLFELPISRQLLVLGTAKNNTLPDIVKGGLSPSYAQKYNDELAKAKMENDKSSLANEAVRDDLSGIAGVY